MPTITGTSGADTLVGGPGDDTIYAGDGDDVIFVGESGNDAAYGEGGNDNFVIRRRGSQGAESLIFDGGAGNDQMHLVADGRHIDTVRVYGGTGNDEIVVTGFASSVIDAGDGDDVLYLSESGGIFDVTLGAGRDVVYFNSWLYGDFYDVEYGQSSYVFRDFTTGDAGDQINLESFVRYRPNWNEGDNPFATGHLRLVQDGASCLLRFDSNGGGDSFIDLARFENTILSDFTAANFNGWNPIATTTEGRTIVGTSQWDQIWGTSGDDVIYGLGGGDTIFGLGGNDTLYGGADSDELDGGDGIDILYGGTGDDRLRDWGGGGSLFGEGGDDNLLFNPDGIGPFPPPTPGQPPTPPPPDRVGVTVLLDGGVGNDDITFDATQRYKDTVTLLGGAGNDIIRASFVLHATYDGGDGDDTLVVTLGGGAYTVTTGSGSDLVAFSGYGSHNGEGPLSVTVTDFVGGAGGDRLNLDSYARQHFADVHSGQQYFLTGHLRVLQIGQNSFIQVRTSAGYETLVTLSGVEAWTLTSSNLVGQDPGGYDAGDLTILGTVDDDVLRGAVNSDLIEGGGNDHLILGSGGADRGSGGSGNDVIEAVRSGSYSGQHVVLEGGAGDDTLTIIGSGRLADTASLQGGDGNDRIVAGGIGEVTVNAGDGDDRVDVSIRAGDYEVRLGQGRDILGFDLGAHSGAPGLGAGGASINVLDFEAGVAGDRIDVMGLARTELSNWNDAYNPFATGHFRLVDDGPDCRLEIDRDGGGDGFSLLAVLKGVSLADLTSDNFSGLNPFAAPVPPPLTPPPSPPPPPVPPPTTGGVTQSGDAGDDALTGTEFADSLSGMAGNDVLRGLGGDDLLDGGEGNDLLVGGTGSDTITGGAGIDRAVWSGLYQGYAHSGGFSGMTIGGGAEGGTDSVAGVETVQFLDGALSYETDTWQSVVYRMYDAAFDRGPDPFGMKTWSEALANGTNLRVLSDTFEASAEFQTRYGALNNTNFIKEMYRFSLNREADAPGLLHWENLMAGGMSRAEVLFHFSESQEHKTVMTNRILAQGMWIQDEKTISIARLYDAILDRVPDLAGLKAYRAQMETGATLTQVATALMQDPGFQTVYGGLSNQAFVEKMYLTILNRAGTANEISILTGYLNNGTPRVDLLLGLSETIEHALLYQATWNTQVRTLENGLHPAPLPDEAKHAEVLPVLSDDAFAPQTLPGEDRHDAKALIAEVSPLTPAEADAHILRPVGDTAVHDIAAGDTPLPVTAEVLPVVEVKAEVSPVAEVLPGAAGAPAPAAFDRSGDTAAFDDAFVLTGDEVAPVSEILPTATDEAVPAAAIPDWLQRHGDMAAFDALLDHMAPADHGGHRSHAPHPDDLFA